MVRAAIRQNLLRRPGDLRLHFGIVEALPGAGRRRVKNAGAAVRPCSRREPARRRDEHQLRRKSLVTPNPAVTPQVLARQTLNHWQSERPKTNRHEIPDGTPKPWPDQERSCELSHQRASPCPSRERASQQDDRVRLLRWKVFPFGFPAAATSDQFHPLLRTLRRLGGGAY